MHTSRFLVLFLAWLSVVALGAAEPSTATAEFKVLAEKIQAKLKIGEASETALATELKEFDALIAKHRAQKTEEVARIVLSQAALYIQVLRQQDKAAERLRLLKDEFADTESGKRAAEALQEMERREAGKNLAGRPAPELNFIWASRPDLKTLSSLKGKVVVLDFWATWCGPCVASFPEMRELVTRYKDFPVEIVGVTSIQGRVMGLDSGPVDTQDNPAKEMQLMKDYIKAKELTWTVAFSQEPVFNPDYGIEGIPHLTIVAPDGTVRHNNLDPRDPLADKAAKIDALLKEFKLKAPVAL